jgi:hypothetical protein
MGIGLACGGRIGVGCLMTNPSVDETNSALAPLRKQLAVLLGLCGLAVATIVVCLLALFFYLQDFTNRASVLDAKADYLEKQSEEIKRIGADLRMQLARLGATTERVRQEPSITGAEAAKANQGGAEVPRAEPNQGGGEAAQATASQGVGEENRNAADQEGSNTAIGLIAAPPLPRPRAKIFAAARPGSPVELKVGSVISPAQVALQPIPDELADKIPRLKGKQFFRHSEQIFVVDPKDNRIVELLN